MKTSFQFNTQYLLLIVCMYIANAGTSRYIKVRMNICTGGTAECKHLRGIFALVATARRRIRPPPPSTPPCTSGSRPSGRCSPVGGFCQRGNLPKMVVKDICQGYLPRILRRRIILNSPLPQPSKLPWPWPGLRSRLRWGLPRPQGPPRVWNYSFNFFQKVFGTFCIW